MSIFHWLFLRFFRKFCDPKIFQKYFSSDSKNVFLRWNIFKFVLKCAHWSPLSNEPKTIEIVRVVQKLSTKRCRGHYITRMCHFPWFEVPISFRDLRNLGNKKRRPHQNKKLRCLHFLSSIHDLDRPVALWRWRVGTGRFVCLALCQGAERSRLKKNLKSDISIIQCFENLIIRSCQHPVFPTPGSSGSLGQRRNRVALFLLRCRCSVVLVHAAQADRDAPRAPGEAPEHRAFKFRFFHNSNNSWCV